MTSEGTSNKELHRRAQRAEGRVVYLENRLAGLAAKFGDKYWNATYLHRQNLAMLKKQHNERCIWCAFRHWRVMNYWKMWRRLQYLVRNIKSVLKA